VYDDEKKFETVLLLYRKKKDEKGKELHVLRSGVIVSPSRNICAFDSAIHA